MTKLTFNTSDGNVVTVDSDVFKGYLSESYKNLDAISEKKKDQKELVEVISETIGLEKKYVNKYLNARYKYDTKAATTLSDIFQALDGAVGEAE